MRFENDLAIQGVATWLPPARQTAAEAVAAGRLEAEEAEATGAVEVPVSEDVPAPQMATRAGLRALERAGLAASEIDFLIHGWMYHQGHDLWSPAHYIADQIGASEAVPFNLQQLSHGSAMALQMAAYRLIADPSARSTMVTTGDRFAGPGFDRWGCDDHIAFGDGGTAAVIGRSERGLRLVSNAVVAAPELEVMCRGRDEFSPAPLMHSQPIDARRPKKAFFEDGGKDRLAIGPVKVREVLLTALADAGLEPDDHRIRCVTLSRLGFEILNTLYLPIVEELMKAEALRLGANTGHLGCGDVLANLADITEQQMLKPGEYALVLTGAAGFTYSCLVVQQL